MARTGKITAVSLVKSAAAKARSIPAERIFLEELPRLVQSEVTQEGEQEENGDQRVADSVDPCDGFHVGRMHRKQERCEQAQPIAAEEFAAHQEHQADRGAVQQDADQVIAQRRFAEEFIADEEGEIGERAIKIRNGLLSLLGEKGSSKKFSDIAEAVDIGIELDLRMVVEDKTI